MDSQSRPALIDREDWILWKLLEAIDALATAVRYITCTLDYENELVNLANSLAILAGGIVDDIDKEWTHGSDN